MSQNKLTNISNTDSNKINFEILNKSHYHSAYHCIEKTLNESITLFSYIKVPKEDYHSFIEISLNKAIQLGLSYVAIDVTTKEVVAIIISKDLTDEISPNITSTENKLLIIFSLIKKLWEPYQNHEEMFLKNQNLHCLLAATLPSYQRKGILKKLFKLTNNLGLERGFKKIIAEATSKFSLNFIQNSTQYKELNSIRYKDYEVNETKPFHNIQPHEKCVLISIPITNLINQ